MARAAVLLVVALVAAACTSPPEDPEAALVRTVTDTFEGSFAYRLVAEADREALASLGDQLGSVAARLNVFEATGIVDDEVSSVDLHLFGTAPLAQLRRFGDERTYLRVGFDDGPLSTLASPELEGRLLGVAVQTGQPQPIVDAIGVLFDGDWVALDGAFDASMLQDGEGGAGPAPATGLGTPLPDVVAEYVTVGDQVDGDGRTTYRVDLRVRELLSTMAELGGGPAAAGVDPQSFDEGLGLLPDTVTGDVVVGDGVVRQIVFDVAAAARADGVDIPGTLELRLELTNHGSPPTPAEPEPGVVVPSDVLATGLQQLFTTPPPLDDLPTPTGTPSEAP